MCYKWLIVIIVLTIVLHSYNYSFFYLRSLYHSKEISSSIVFQPRHVHSNSVAFSMEHPVLLCRSHLVRRKKPLTIKNFHDWHTFEITIRIEFPAFVYNECDPSKFAAPPWKQICRVWHVPRAPIQKMKPPSCSPVSNHILRHLSNDTYFSRVLSEFGTPNKFHLI